MLKLECLSLKYVCTHVKYNFMLQIKPPILSVAHELIDMTTYHERRLGKRVFVGFYRRLKFNNIKFLH